MPLAAGDARGSDLQETVIQAVIYPAAPTGIAAFAIVLWGLRHVSPRRPASEARST
jgi:hydroxylaminobenzene mutase